ncbi:MAG: tripartite tricarboxylate transporter substrate binding protein BugD [Burkholderiaceae bacterium]|nr:tripartite tricarboxylate transporter substrate binding protein BugD [Burkholderiaceae bacterium]
MLKRAAIACVAFAFGAALPAAAQEYPARPPVIVVPFSAGGPTDTLTRHLAVAMGAILKQQIIIENVVGAGGTIGAAKVAKAKPDGYTLLVYHIGMATAPALYRRLPFNPANDFEPIGLISDVPMTFIANEKLPPANLKDLIAYVKANKGKISYGNAGLGAASHLCGLLFMSRIDTDLNTVPYKGTGPALAALLGNEIQLMCDQTTNTTGHILSKKVKVYGVTTRTRLGVMPDVPTLSESGLKDFEIAIWHGLYAPKGTPKPIVDRLVASLQAALKDARFVENLAKLATEPVAQERATPAALRAHLKAEMDKWGPIIRKAGVYAD